MKTILNPAIKEDKEINILTPLVNKEDSKKRFDELLTSVDSQEEMENYVTLFEEFILRN